MVSFPSRVPPGNEIRTSLLKVRDEMYAPYNQLPAWKQARCEPTFSYSDDAAS